VPAADVHDRLAAILAAHGAPERLAGPLGAVLDLVAGDAAAPTTVREPASGVDVHVADSLSGLELAAVREARVVADLGAGAGFPGLVLAAALPGARVALVESLGRKCAFLERAVAVAGLGNAEVVCRRAEEWPEGHGRHDVVTARAVAPLAVLAEYAAPLLAPGGSLVAWKGARDPAEEAAGAAAAALLGLEVAEVRRVHPFPAAEQRHLHRYVKVGPTPDRFPRRPGMARKRPLAGAA
jgi:16S rRNA (guanine527-N7)-methyltransferase